MARYPDFLFIGAMKSATTSISSQLGMQPGIFMVSDPKELFFFSRDEIYSRGIDWYTSNFDGVPTNELCGEAATTYTQKEVYPLSVERMQQHLPNANLIYLMRHPIDRLISHYTHDVIGGRISVGINEAIDKHPELVSTSQYASQLKPYFEAFGYNQILPSFFERLNASPQAELERVCDFIGYAGTPQWSSDLKPKNVSKNRVQRNALTDFLRRAPVLSQVREYLVPSSLKTLIRKPFVAKVERPELSPENLERLKSIFDEDLAELGQWLGIELTCDTFKTVAAADGYAWSAVGLENFRSGVETAAG
ncbi:MAG: sulfotransferase domain-containing protein [Cyanobacteria bacterium J06597_1]